MLFVGLLPGLETVVRRAGQLAMELRPALHVTRKADGTAVTQADVAVEELLATELHRLFPEAAFLGEEGHNAAIGEDVPVWVADPIDGTDAYRQGLAYFGVSVGLLHGGETQVGAFYNPHLDEMYLAVRGHGATLNGHPIRVMQREKITRDCFVCGSSDFHRFFRLDLPLKVRSLGSTANHLALVADGRSCFCFCHPRIWDVAAAALLIEEAGGEVWHLDGSRFHPGRHLDGRMIMPPLAAGPPNLLAEVLKRITWQEK